jgi:hypothetical protein
MMRWKKMEKIKKIIGHKILPGKKLKIRQEIGLEIYMRPRIRTKRKRRAKKTKRRKISQSIRRKITKESIRKVGGVQKASKKSSESVRIRESTHQALFHHLLRSAAKV